MKLFLISLVTSVIIYSAEQIIMSDWLLWICYIQMLCVKSSDKSGSVAQTKTTYIYTTAMAIEQHNYYY